MTSETENNRDAFIYGCRQDTDTFVSLKRDNILKEEKKKLKCSEIEGEGGDRRIYG